LSNNDKDKAETVLKEGLKHFPENGKFLYDLADLYIEQKKNTEAIELLQKATVAFKSANSFELASFVQGAIGDIYSSMKETDKAFVAYDSALVLNENNIMVLNNYAYYLSEKGINLDKAELMSGKAVKEESNNPSYLDTYAWIYFKKGNYTLALLYIEQAMKNGGENSVAVLEHYGDILFKSGDKEKAVKMWRNAFALDEMGVLKNGHESQASPFLKRKIEEQQYIDK
jgi:tetratricopeptide (TPR) repeat protein